MANKKIFCLWLIYESDDDNIYCVLPEVEQFLENLKDESLIKFKEEDLFMEENFYGK